MRLPGPSKLLLVIGCWPWVACAQLQLLPDAAPQAVFAAGSRTINVVWRNAGDNMVQTPMRMQLYQASSSTAAPMSEMQDWKQLQVLPRQTVLENVSVTVPAVNAETRFVIQWLAETNKVLGHTDLMVYPTNLLNELKPLAGEKAIGLFDPQNLLKPLLKMEALEVEDLEEEGLKGFSGKLAIIGPFPPSATEPSTRSIGALARTGVAVVWLQPAPKTFDQLRPSFYFVSKDKGMVLVADAGLVSNLAENPRSQLNLIALSKLALHPGNFGLPASDDESQLGKL